MGSHSKAAVIRTRAWLLDELAIDAIVEASRALVSDFQANPATGTFLKDPQNINNNNTTDYAEAHNVDEYAEVDFQKPVIIERWRQWGATEMEGDGVWKLQYYDLASESWQDWVTGIATRTLDSWSDYVTETVKMTTKIRLVCTTLDTCGTLNRSYLKELEVIY
jgi:hypothetical protein